MTDTPRFIVVMAFFRDEDGELQPAFEPREMQSEVSARSQAQILAGSRNYAGVIAWSRTADPTIGEYGPPEELYRWGEVPEME
jgi:hypothetical protein